MNFTVISEGGDNALATLPIAGVKEYQTLKTNKTDYSIHVNHFITSSYICQAYHAAFVPHGIAPHLVYIIHDRSIQQSQFSILIILPL